MRSVCGNTLWIQNSTISSQWIIPTIEISAASQLTSRRSPYGNVKDCIPAARFALMAICESLRMAVTGNGPIPDCYQADG
jgi:hypothetical protein